MGKIVRDRYTQLSETDQEAIRQHAIAALNITQQAAKVAANPDAEIKANTAFIDGVRHIRDGRPRTEHRPHRSDESVRISICHSRQIMNEERLQQVAAAIAQRNIKLTPERQDLANVPQLYKEHGRNPSLTSPMHGAGSRRRYSIYGSRERGAMTDLDLDSLEDELKAFAEPDKKSGRSAREERIIAGFEEIQKFVNEHGRQPLHGEGRDIFERLHAVRLDRLRQLPDCREILTPLDRQGLLGRPGASDGADDDALMAELDGLDAPSEIENLVHVPRLET
jgi:hypothetical protein